MLIGTLGVALLLRDTLPRAALYMKRGYVAVFDSNIEGLLWRAGILAVALLMTVALLVLVPAGQTPFTWLGEVTLYVYLLHGLLISPLRPTIASWELRWPHVAALVAGAVLLTLLLGSRPVRRATGWLIEPRLTWLLRPEPQPSAPRPVPQSQPASEPAPPASQPAGSEPVGWQPGDVPLPGAQPESPALTEATMRLPVVPQPAGPANPARPPAVPLQREP